jgi:ABC-2 type transport system ATP-binding protein
MLSSHHLHQVQAVCDRVGLFHKGKLVLNGTVEALARQMLGAGWRVHLEADGADDLRAALQAVPGVRSARHMQANGKSAHWLIESETDVRPALVRAALAAGAEVRELHMEQASLDDVYARYFETGQAGNATGAQP